MPSTPWTYARADLADVDAILGLMREYYADDGYPFDASISRRALERLLLDERLGELWVVRDAGELVAYLALTFGYSLEYRGRDAFVDEVVVAASHRGRGLGTLALELAERRCREVGVGALHLEVEESKPEAERLYRRAGFEPRARRLLTRLLE
jgi:GNAT superfamily N-acetyltransferase